MNSRRRGLGRMIGERPVLSAVAVVALGLGAVGVGDYVSVENQTDRRPVPAGSCESPFFTTTHGGDPQASGITQYLGGRTGVVLQVAAGEQATGVRAAYRSPDDAEWVDRSAMLPVDALGSATLTLAIGKDDVVFGVQVIGPEGNQSCAEAPLVAVDIQGVGEYRNRPGQTPWPNPGEYLTNLGVGAPPL